MTPALGGASAREAPPADDLAARRLYDLGALASARRPAKQAMAALLVALLNPGTDPTLLEALSREAHLATGRLWEALAHLNEG